MSWCSPAMKLHTGFTPSRMRSLPTPARTFPNRHPPTSPAQDVIDVSELLGEQRDSLARVLATEGDVPQEPVLAALEHVAAGHLRHERQRVVRLEHEPAPDVAAGQARLLGIVIDGNG